MSTLKTPFKYDFVGSFFKATGIKRRKEQIQK